jgi:hypothetical protein
MGVPPGLGLEAARAARKKKAAETEASLPGDVTVDYDKATADRSYPSSLMPARSSTARNRTTHTGHGTLLVQSGFHSVPSYCAPLNVFSPRADRIPALRPANRRVPKSPGPARVAVTLHREKQVRRLDGRRARAGDPGGPIPARPPGHERSAGRVRRSRSVAPADGESASAAR